MTASKQQSAGKEKSMNTASLPISIVKRSILQMILNTSKKFSRGLSEELVRQIS